MAYVTGFGNLGVFAVPKHGKLRNNCTPSPSWSSVHVHSKGHRESKLCITELTLILIWDWRTLVSLGARVNGRALIFKRMPQSTVLSRLKAATHEGFCSRSMLQGHALGGKLLRVYQRFHGCTSSSGAEFPPRKMLHDI